MGRVGKGRALGLRGGGLVAVVLTRSGTFGSGLDLRRLLIEVSVRSYDGGGVGAEKGDRAPGKYAGLGGSEDCGVVGEVLVDHE